MELDAPSRYNSTVELIEELQTAIQLLKQSGPQTLKIPIRPENASSKKNLQSYFFPALATLVILVVLALAAMVILRLGNKEVKQQESYEFIIIEEEEIDGISVPSFEMQSHEVTNQAYCNFLNCHR